MTDEIATGASHPRNDGNNEILNQVSVFASDCAKASNFAKAMSDKSTDKKATPDRQDDGSVESRRGATTMIDVDSRLKR
jgi:hypothetical protein